MARTRQKAKQRKAKRLEQERKASERTQRPDGGSATQQAAAEVEDAQLRAAAELEEAQRDEVGAAAEAARSAAAAEAATGAEAATTKQAAPVPEVDEAPPKPTRRERRKAEVAGKEKARPAPRAERKREARRRGRVVNFLVQVWAELRRVQWPDRNQVTQATSVTIVFCVVAGAYLGIWDFVFNKLVNALL